MTADAHHITAPPEDGRGAVQCMRRALQDAGLPPDAIGYVNAHATSTMADRVETSAIKQVFGTHARSLAVSSTKSMTGHLLGAAGGVEAVFSVLAIHRGILPPTINQEVPDPECDLDYVPNVARRAEVRAVLSNSFRFGGGNACLIFSRCPAQLLLPTDGLDELESRVADTFQRTSLVLLRLPHNSLLHEAKQA